MEKLRLGNFQGSQVSFLDFSTLYTSLPHDLIKAKVLSPVKWCFNRVKNGPLYFRSGRISLQQEIWLVYSLDLHWVMYSLYFPHAIWWHRIQTNIAHGHKLCSTYSRLIFILLREGLYVKPPEIQTVWPNRQCKFNDTSRYTHHPLITLNLLSIFPIYIQEIFNLKMQLLRTKKHLSWI